MPCPPITSMWPPTRPSFAGGDIATDDSFSIKTNTDDTIAGSIHNDDPLLFDDDSVTATVAGQTVTATRVGTFWTQ